MIAGMSSACATARRTEHVVERLLLDVHREIREVVRRLVDDRDAGCAPSIAASSGRGSVSIASSPFSIESTLVA